MNETNRPLKSIYALSLRRHAPFPHRAAILQHMVNTVGHPVKLPWSMGAYRLFNTPSSIQHILVDKSANYTKFEPYYNRIRDAMGRSLLTNEGDSWHSQRKQIQPHFYQQSIEAFAPMITNTVAQHTQTWQDNEQVDIAKSMLVLTAKITARLFFNEDYTQHAPQLVKWITWCNRYITVAPFFVPAWFPDPNNMLYRYAKWRVRRILSETVIKRQQQKPQDQDILDVILRCHHHNDPNTRIDQMHIIEEATGLFINGHETLGATLAYVWKLLAQNPDCYQKLHAEVDTVLGGQIPTAQDIERLDYTKMVIQETMRLYPPVWVMPRQAIADDEIDGIPIPARSRVMISPYITHRDEDYWPDPLKFDPTRFSSEASRGRHKYLYYPFGGGARVCIASRLAMQQAILIVAMISQRYTFDLQTSPTMRDEALIIFKPRDPIRMTIVKR